MRFGVVAAVTLLFVTCAAKPAAPTPEPVFVPEPGAQPPPADLRTPPPESTRTASGLVYNFLEHGTGGPHPTSRATVKVDYTGWTQDGRMFDSSRGRGTAELPLDAVIAGWTEGLQLLSAGDSVRLWIPAALAYRGQVGAPGGLLVFDVKLVSFVEPITPPPTPWDVSAPPPSAERTPSGLAFRVLSAGTGTVHPAPGDRVKVSYSTWTSSGRLVDSSVMRGAPDVFALSAVVPGFAEGIQLMVVGEKTRLWVPAEVDQRTRALGPSGTLVFDIELIAINPE